MESDVDGTTPQGRIKRLKDRIQDSDDISDEDAKILIEFSESLALQRTTYSHHRHEKLLRHCTIIAENVGGLAEALNDRETTETIVRWINKKYENEETNRDYRVALRVFGRRTTDDNGDLPPDSIEWVESGTSATYDPSPEPRNMLDWEDEVLPMLDATRNTRDRAAIALAFDAGPRGGEFEALTIGDFTDTTNGLKVTLNGKQGKRTVTLVPSVEYVTSWLAEHPGQGDNTSPMWTKLDEPDPLSYRMITKMIRRPGQRAGVDKPLTITNFRKSSAAYLASKGLNQPHIEDHHGWVRGSDVANRYVSVFAKDREREVKKVWGEDVPEADQDPGIAPINCPRCDRRTPREKPLCVWCGQALEPGAAKLAEKVDTALVDLIAEAEGEDARELVEIREEVRDDPDLKSDVVDRIASKIEPD